ncbi:50S ribosomal protein L21 [Algimonas arctica]|uniref:Large ribosomal subunit protein bL21 n=1 Tax=Algimonas arctica TaxID=1479486 RepID=A0A8J3G238_9PROT|nr:50S ribosomal protein L21 [Algimonas arctica]GHA91348.1 50S ribosomal protein L21 [Algimonas arctica]
MFAVIKTGGKQYKVAKDDIIIVEKLDTEEGKTVTFDDVLMHGADGDVKVGVPMVDGASVTGEVIEQRKGEKVLVFKKKRRQNYRRKRGHRQLETVVRITGITG